jgi:hypothetical protein
MPKLHVVGTHGIAEPTLRKHFRRELDVSLTEVKALAMFLLSDADRLVNEADAKDGGK